MAQAIEALGQLLQASTMLHGTEFAAMVDAATGTRVGGILQGTASGVDISPLLQALMPGRRYVSLHTHPGSSAFSDADGALLARYPAIRTLVVVGANGTRYLLNKRSGMLLPTPDAVEVAWNAEYLNLRPHYRTLVQSGAMTTQAAWLGLTNAIWQSIAPQLGLRYDRILPP
ncbi:MAG: hypothetical protein HY690_13435 [Chloroflexi bacterium]|nr:hypothetical protein [Chloroflexota bacterium]